jgi:hypothetical protein
VVRQVPARDTFERDVRYAADFLERFFVLFFLTAADFVGTFSSEVATERFSEDCGTAAVLSVAASMLDMAITKTKEMSNK